MTDRDDGLRAAMRSALVARDGAARSPRFDRMMQAAWGRPPADLQPAFAALVAAVVIAGLSWVFLDREAAGPAEGAELRAAAELAHELSSPDYWRVPTDELLAFAAPPLDAELPAPEGFNVSLEESLL